MAWRFKASKYKNSAPIVPKFDELIRDLSIGSYRSHGNFIAASAAFMAFNWDVQGSNLAVLPLDTKGRQNKATVPLIFAHSDFVTDFQFSPFDDGLLATGSQDLTVKLWRIPKTGLEMKGLNQPELVLASQPRRVETVTFHPTSDCILASTSFDSLVIWDLIQAKELYNFQDHADEVQSLAWQPNGKLLATQCKDRQLRVLDPRQSQLCNSTESHQGIKDSKLVWISNETIFTSGFNQERAREIALRDLRNLSTPLKNLTLDMSAGILIPLFDPDTNMCFLAGKGDRNIQFIELTNKDPFIIEGLKYSGEQTKGACLVPKRAMDVMQGEVNRVLQLCDSSVTPITWQVPRKSYREYHADIYPETDGLEAGCGPSTWWKGQNFSVPKINLDPSKRPSEVLTVFGGALSERDANKTSENGENGKNGEVVSSPNGFAKPNPRPRCVVKANVTSPQPQPTVPNKPVIAPRITPNKPTAVNKNGNNADEEDSTAKNNDGNDEDSLAMLRRQPSIRDRKKLFEQQIQQQNQNEPKKNHENNKENRPKSTETKAENNSRPLSRNIFVAMEAEEKPKQIQQTKKKPTSKMFVRASKFKHLKGDVILKGRFENLKNLSRTVPAECNFIKANEDRIAVPLTGAGGKLAIFETRKPGRIPDGVTPVLINGTTVLDFEFDPFDKTRLAAGCDDGMIRVWKIPSEGLSCQVNQPHMEWSGHGDKVQIVKWHPLAADVLLTVAFDKTVRVWDLNETDAAKVELEGHTDQLFSAEWSGCGRYVASVCKDGKIRIFEPRNSTLPIIEGGEIVAKKGARVAWVLNGQYLIVTGFSKVSERQVMVYKIHASSLSLEHTQILDVSPAILIPHYDQDSSTLFLTSRGESTVTTFEVSLDAPHLFPLSPYRPSGLHQGFVFLPKKVLDVKNVEFARAYRLTSNTIEPISFTVPRVKTNFFQDDLFPPTRTLWEPTLSAQEWIQGSLKQAGLVSLCPEGMRALSGTNNKPPPSKQQDLASNFPAPPSQNQEEVRKKAEIKLENSVKDQIQVETKMEQDQMEGVDASEWDE